MPLKGDLSSLLVRLRLLGGRPFLMQSVDNNKTVTETISEFKRALVVAIKRNAISDETIVQSADCLYDLKACDRNTSAQICKIVESRPAIYTKPLYGGLLWAFSASANFNVRRKKAVKSSCNATIVTFLDQLLALQADEKLSEKLGETLRNLSIVGRCFRLPSSTLARLEQAIVNARDALSRGLHSTPVTVNYLIALYSLQVKSEAIAEHAVSLFLAALCCHEVMSINCASTVIRTLSLWKVNAVTGPYNAIKILNRQLESSPPESLLKNASALVKLYVASSRIRTRNATSNGCDVSGVTEVARVPSMEGSCHNDVPEQSSKDDDVCRLSGILLQYCCDIVERFSSHNLLLLYNAMSHSILNHEKHCDYSAGKLNDCIRRITQEVRDALELDMSAACSEGSVPSRLYDKKDLMTIIRSALITSRVCSSPSSEVASIARQLLETRYGTDIKEVEKSNEDPSSCVNSDH